MSDNKKTKAQLVVEIRELRQQVAALQELQPAIGQPENDLRPQARQLKRDARLLEAILATSPAYFFVYDSAMTYTYASFAGAEALGLTRNGMVGKHWRELGFPVEILEPLEAQVQEVFATGRPYVGETQFPTNDGVRYYEYLLTPMYHPDGHTEAVLCTISDTTLHKKATRERDRFFTFSLDLICVAGFDGYFKQLNPSWNKVLGFTSEELIAKPFIEFVHPDDRVATMAQIERLSAGEDTLAFENRYICKDGSCKWLFWNATVSSEDQSIYAIARDVTERKQEQELLERKNTLIHLLQEMAVAANEAPSIEAAYKTALDLVHDYLDWPIGHVYVQAEDDQNRIVPTAIWRLDAPKRFEKFQKVTMATPIASGDGFLGRVVKHREPSWLNDVSQAPNFIRAKAAEAVGIRAGLAIPILVGNEVAAVLEFFSDQPLAPDKLLLKIMGQIGTQLGRVIERERAATALELYRTLARNFPGGSVVLYDRNLRFKIAEGQGLDKLGFSSERMEGKTIWELFPAELRQRIEPAYRAALAGKKNINEVEYEDRSYSIHTLPVRNARGEISAGMSVAQDITSLKQAEGKLVEMVAELRSVNQELNDFAYIVSHDLKAPLRAIGSLANWLSTDYADKFDEDGQEQMGLLINRVHRMNRLIEGILQYSRVGRVKENHVEVDLNKLVPEIIDSCAPPDHITITIENELPTIIADRTRLGQIFQNLISNAIKYDDKPQGQISINCEDKGPDCQFSIADNSLGIAERHFDKIFQMFQTLSPRDKIESSGIGLALVKRIVENYGGKIWVESAEGAGSTFFFTLPKQQTK